MTRSNLIHLDAERMARRGDKPMPGLERLAEFVWLLDLGSHPIHAAAQLGTNVEAIMKLARDKGRPDIATRTAALTVRADRAEGQGERRRVA